jgi:hypothetical protein
VAFRENLVAHNPEMSISSLPIGTDDGQSWGSAADNFINELDPSDPMGASWARKQQAHLFNLDEVASEWAESVALLTATASTSWPTGDQLIPPVVHFEMGIRASRQARQKALSRALSESNWRAIRAYDAHETGHVHQHVAVYIDREVDSEELQPWVRAHLNNSPLADQQAHESGAVKLGDVEGDGATWAPAYVMQGAPGLDTTGDREHGIKSAPTNRQRAGVVLDRVDSNPITFGQTPF